MIIGTPSWTNGAWIMQLNSPFTRWRNDNIARQLDYGSTHRVNTEYICPTAQREYKDYVYHRVNKNS